MHIPDGILSPTVCVATGLLAGAFIALATKYGPKDLDDKQAPLLGVSAAFIFATQMINYPIGFGASGHLMGAVLAATLLGPLNAALVLALVLMVQCLAFSDGGLTALGANICNMAIVGGLGGFGAQRLAQHSLPQGRSGFLASVAIASWVSVVAAALGCALEVVVSGRGDFSIVVPALVGIHAVIGVGEAFITTTVIGVVLEARPDLIAAWPASASSPAEALAS